MTLFQRLKAAGIRKLIFYFFIFLIQKTKAVLYLHLFSNLSPVLKGSTFNQPAQFLGQGLIKLSGVTVGVWSSPYFLSSYAYFEAREPSAEIVIGEGTFLNNNASIIADRSKIEIGRQCLIGLRVNITDSDFHGLEIDNRNNGEYICMPVRIGNNVFIGNDVKILKGVTVGDGAVIAAGAIVTSDIPSMSIYGGVPAKFIRDIVG